MTSSSKYPNRSTLKEHFLKFEEEDTLTELRVDDVMEQLRRHRQQLLKKRLREAEKNADVAVKSV